MLSFSSDRKAATTHDWHGQNIYRGDHTKGEIEVTEIATEPSFENPFCRVFEDPVILPNGNPGTYLRIDSGAKDGVPRPDGAIVVPILKAIGQVIFVRQFRHDTRRAEIGLPRGFGHYDKSAQETAILEMLSETGCEAIELIERGHVQPDNGKLGDLPRIWVALVEKYTPEVLDKEEAIQNIFLVPYREALNACIDGELECGLSTVALLRAKPFADSLA